MDKRTHKQRRRKLPTRMLALLLSFSFLWNDAAIVSLAAESGEEKSTEESYRQALEEFDSYKEELNTLYEGIDFKAAEDKNEDSYTSHVLIVQLKGGMNTAVPSTNPRYVMDLGDGLFAVSYPDADSTKDAEAVLKESSEISYVEPDYILKTCDLTEEPEQESGEEESETDNPAPESDIEESLMENDNEELNVPETGAYQEGTPTLQEAENLVLESNLSTNASSAQENSESTEENVPEEIPEEKVRVILLDDVDSEEEGSFHGNHVQDVFWTSLSENGGNADGVEFISLSAFDKNGYGTTLTTYLSVHTAMKLDADVLVMPFAGNGESELLTRLFDETEDKGIFLVSSIGNEGTDAETVLPAQHKNVISIGSVTAGKERCGYSNYGENLDFVCYGKYKTTDGETFRGTSAACAYFAGYAVSIKEKNREMAVNELLDSLKNEAEDLGTPGKDEDYGYGLIGGIPEGAVDEMADAPAAKGEDESSKSEDQTEELETQEPEAYAVMASSPFRIYQYGNGYVGIELHGFSSYPSMKIGVWCIENGQDDLCWYNMTKRDDGVWIYTFPLSNHGQEGVYAVHAYYGSTNTATGSFTVSGPSATGALVGATGSTDTLYAYGFNIKPGSNTISKVQLAVWTEEYGQDDLCWYDAWQAWSNADGTTYAVAFDIKEHKRLASGTYNVHVYVTDTAGIRKCVATWRGTATCTSSYNQNMSKTGYHVEQTGSEECYHYASNASAFVTCMAKTLTPSNGDLYNGYYVENHSGTDFPLSNLRVESNTPDDNYYAAMRQDRVKLISMYVDAPDIGKITLAHPYYCGKDGYAGYACIRHNFSYCDKTAQWFYSGAEHEMLWCGQQSRPSNPEHHPRDFAHVVGIYSLKPNTYTISFDGNGATSGSMGNLSMTYDTPKNLPANGFKRNGYKFAGWSTSPNGNVDYTDKQSVKNLTAQNGGTVTLYAKWVASNPPTIIRIKNVQNRTDGFWTYAYVEDNGDGISRVVFPIWSRKNGQDDLMTDWYHKAAGTKGEYKVDGETYNYRYYTKASSHNNEYGLHDVHVYAIDNYEGHSCKTSTFQYEYQIAYIGNGQDAGADFVQYRKKSGTTEILFDNGGIKKKEQYFLKDAKVSFKDSITGEEIYEDTTQTVVGWSLKNDNNQSTMYPAGASYSTEELLLEAMKQGNLTSGSPAEAYESYPKGGVKTGIDETAYLTGSDIFVNLYAVWDKGAVIEAYDLYYTLADAQAGVISEEELLSQAAAYDEELKTDQNPDGEMAHGTDKAKNTSFTVSDYSESDFTSFTKSGKVSITYEAVDAAGNHTKRMVDVHIIDPDAKNMLKAKGDIRFISSKYLDTLREDSVWRTEEEYKNLLNETLSYKRTNPDTSDPLPVFGDAYKRTIEGTGTWNKTPKAEWRFTKEQIGEVKEYLDTYGPSNYQTENGLSQFMDTFGTCKVK